MKKIWKEFVTLVCFVFVYCLLFYEHETHMQDLVIKELPYIAILLVTVIFGIWCSEKLKYYRINSKLNDKMSRLCDQYDFEMDEGLHTTSNCNHIIDQMIQQLKKDELHLSAFEYRYRKVADITNQVMFEYNVINHTICDSNNWHTIGDGNAFIQETIAKEFVHPDDAQIFARYFEEPYLVGRVNEITIRLRTIADPTYYNTNIRGIVLENINGEPEKIIGSRTTLKKAN